MPTILIWWKRRWTSSFYSLNLKITEFKIFFFNLAGDLFLLHLLLYPPSESSEWGGSYSEEGGRLSCHYFESRRLSSTSSPNSTTATAIISNSDATRTPRSSQQRSNKNRRQQSDWIGGQRAQSYGDAHQCDEPFRISKTDAHIDHSHRNQSQSRYRTAQTERDEKQVRVVPSGSRKWLQFSWKIKWNKSKQVS